MHENQPIMIEVIAGHDHHHPIDSVSIKSRNPAKGRVPILFSASRIPHKS